MGEIIMGFNELSKLWFLTLLIPVIIFYFLKLKRPKIKISSLFLWQQVLDDKRVNSPFQRFKRHILLLLQLLILISLVFAATNPYFLGNMNKAKRIPIIIDISASMGALDKKSGTSRLERAKKRVKKLINNKISGQEFSIITFSDRAQRICGFTDNASILNQALEKVQQKDLPANIEDALRMVQAMSKNFQFKEAILFSDGNFPDETKFSLPFTLNFQKIAENVPNIGITALSAQRTGADNWMIFAELTSTGKTAAAALELYHNGELLGEETYVPNSEHSERISFKVPGDLGSSLKLRLKPDGFDALSSDNTAYISLPQLRPLIIYISPNLKSIRAAMRGISNLNIFPPEKNGTLTTPPTTYDLVITDTPSLIELKTNFLFTVGFIPSDLKNTLQREIKDATIIDWDKEAPLLRHTQLGEISIMEGTQFINGKSEKELEKMDYQTIIFGAKGPLLLKKEWADQTVYNLLFYISKSTFPFRIAFPIMMKNLIELVEKKAGLADRIATKTGILPRLILQPDTQYSVKTPSGSIIVEKTAKNGRLPTISAPVYGIYTILQKSNKITETGVSLLDKDETLLIGTDKIKFNALSVSAADKPAIASHSLWKYLAILALIILCIEWWFFNKRV